MPTPGPDLDPLALDRARRLVVERGLVRATFGHLTVDAFMALPFEALGPTKALLKRFFSTDDWGPGDDDALAAAVGPGEGTWRHDLDPDVVLDHGWIDGRFGVRISSSAPTAGPPTAGPPTAGPPTAGPPTAGPPTAGPPTAGPPIAGPPTAGPPIAGPPAAGTPVASGAAAGPPTAGARDPLAGTFDGPVVPEATPNPRSIRFQVGPVHGGPSRWYESAASAADDPGGARLFAEFEEVANVLVGPDFVAVGLHRAADWERLLGPVLEVVTDEFSDPDAPPETSGPRVVGGPAGAGVVAGGSPAPPRRADSVASDRGAPAGGRRLSRLERAWRDLGALRPGARPDDLARVRAAAAGDDPSHRQVAANLLGEAGPDVAAAGWARLVRDPVRSVRRATVDAMVDAGRPELRPLLEAALSDVDAWVRWKALRGLADLGAGPSRESIVALADDPDFRVRLEVAAALRRG